MVKVTPVDRDAAINLDELHIIQVWNIDRVAAAFAHHREYGYEAGVEAAAKALKDDAKKCDCFARMEVECGCGAWDDNKTITSERAIGIIRALQEQGK